MLTMYSAIKIPEGTVSAALIAHVKRGLDAGKRAVSIYRRHNEDPLPSNISMPDMYNVPDLPNGTRGILNGEGMKKIWSSSYCYKEPFYRDSLELTGLETGLLPSTLLSFTHEFSSWADECENLSNDFLLRVNQAREQAYLDEQEAIKSLVAMGNALGHPITES